MPRLAPPAASLADQVARAIREAVRAGTLQPGRLYSAYQMADELGVSRSPVREALLRLAEAGLVALERNRGFRIVVPEPEEIAEVFHLRLLLEVPAARRAALKTSPQLIEELRGELGEMQRAAQAHDEALFMQHDQRLHGLILAAAGNQRLVTIIGNLRDTVRMLGASTVDHSRGLQDVSAEHVPIIDAVASGDAEAAAQAMSWHVTHTGKLLLAQAAAEAGGPLSAEALWDEVVS